MLSRAAVTLSSNVWSVAGHTARTHLRAACARSLSTAAPPGVTVVTLDSPGTRNALSLDMLTRTRAKLQEAADTPGTKVIVLAAEGPVFSAGHDLKELAAAPPDQLARIFGEAGELCNDIRKAKQPVIARVHALATAAGCQLVAACDLVVASRNAKFATPGAKVGIFCSTPAVELSRAVNTKLAMEMLLTGEPISAEQAQQAGLVNRIVDDASQLDDEVHSLAESICAKSAAVIALGKAAFYQQLRMPVQDAYLVACGEMTRNVVSIEDAAEGLAAFAEKRHPTWKDQ